MSLNEPLQIGVTGGVGSGKSTICHIFRVLHVDVYNADDRAKFLMTTDGKLMAAVKEEFGTLSYKSDGSLDRAYLGTTVFNSAELLKRLNRIVHPRVREDYLAWVEEHRDCRYVVKEAALLVETGSFRELDKLVVITAPEPLRLKRVLDRDPQRTSDDVKRIMMNQLSDEEKVPHADYVIRNDETLLVTPQVLKLHDHFNALTY